MRARRQTVFGQRRADVLGHGILGLGKRLQQPSLRRWQLHRRVRPGRQAVLEQRRADVLERRFLGLGRRLRQHGLRLGRVRRKLRARLGPLRGVT